MRRRTWLFLIAFVIYNLNLRPIPAGDTAPAALLPLVMLGDHAITFDRFEAWYTGDRKMTPSWFTQAGDGHFYSSYPIALPVALTPLYAPLAAFVDVQRMPVDRVVLLARVLEKVSASLIAALSVAAFLALAESLAAPGTALLLTIVYAFGSETWSISSQALWQHGAAELAIILSLLCLMWASREPDGRLPAALAGLSAGLGVALRLSGAVFLVILAGYVLLSRWSAARKIVFFLAAIPFPAASLAYNLAVFGDLLGGYRGIGMFRGTVMAGLAGLVISPSRGLLVFSPVFIFAGIGIYLWLRSSRSFHPEIYWICAVAAAAQVLLVSKSRWWHGGYSYGPRLVTDVLPCLVILMIPAMSLVERSRAWRVAFGCLLLVSIGVQGIGAFCYPNGHWDALPESVNKRRERVWDWRDNQIFRSAAAGPVIEPYRLAWGFLAHPGVWGSETLDRQGLKLW